MEQPRPPTHPAAPRPCATWSVCLALVLTGARTGAQAPTPQDVARFELAPLSVTATRNPIRAFDYPGMVTVRGAQALRETQASSPDDLLRTVPGLEFTGGPRRTGEVPSLRGFSGPDVVVLLDGARQNFGSGHDGRFFIDPSLLREVEVLRGPASTLYGSGGMGGVIELRTVDADDLLQPDQRAMVRMAAGYQSGNRERSASLLAAARPLPGLGMVGAVTRRPSGSIKLGDGNELSADDNVTAALVKGHYTPSSGQRLELALQRFASIAEEPNNGQGSGGTDLVEKNLRADNLRLAYSLGGPQHSWLDLDLTAYAAFTRADELRLDGNGGGPQGEKLKRDVDTYGLRAENRSRGALGERGAAVLTYGFEVYRDEQDGGAGAGPRSGVPDARADFAGAFAQAELSLVQPLGLPGELLVIPGLRHDSFDTGSDLATAANADAELSPRLSVSYLPTDWLMAFAGYAQAFRAATFDEAFTTGTHFTIPLGPGTTVVNRFQPNPGLRPQRTTTLEFGAGLSFDDLLEHGDRLQFKASHYITDGEDFIDLQVDQPALFTACNPFVPGQCDGTTRSVNVPEARLRGTELEFRYDGPRLRVQAGYSTIKGKNTRTGAFLGVLTPAQLDIDAAIKLPDRDARLGWRLHTAAEFDQTATASERRDGYAVHDFYLSWAPSRGPLHGVRLDLGLDNAFDRAYSRAFTGATETGRNLKSTLSYEVFW